MSAQRASGGAPAAGTAARDAGWRAGATAATGMVCAEPRLCIFSWKLLLIRKLNDLQGELTPGEPTPIERLLVDRVLANWLRLHFAELAATQAMNRPKHAEFWDRRQSRAERAYLASLGAMTTMRKFLSAVTVAAATTAQHHDSNSTLEGPIVDPTHSGPPLRLVDYGGA